MKVREQKREGMSLQSVLSLIIETLCEVACSKAAPGLVNVVRPPMATTYTTTWTGDDTHTHTQPHKRERQHGRVRPKTLVSIFKS